MKKILYLILCCIICVSVIGCESPKTEVLISFHEKVSESQELMDTVADDIYSNWYDAIYEDEFNEDIDLAIASAMADHSDDLEKIEALENEITELFGQIKDDENNGKLVKDVMSAYSDYYEFVVNVSGSFKSYSADKETLKKELASLLKDLSYEI
ncbi:MAG: hypothetical protein IKD18_02300 [Clostridia bacterium]|nr:hypothetical protein [Clostridia bacterium]